MPHLYIRAIILHTLVSFFIIICPLISLGQTSSSQRNPSFQHQKLRGTETSLQKIWQEYPKMKLSADDTINSKIGSTQTQTCSTSAFRIHLTGSPGQKIRVCDIETQSNGNFLLGGTVGLANNDQEGLICILSNSGSILLSKQFRIDAKSTNLMQLKLLRNGKILLTGIYRDISEKCFVSLLNADLSVVWTKTFNYATPTIKTTIDVFSDTAILLGVQLTDSVAYTILRSDGSIKWSRSMNVSGMYELVSFSQMINGNLCIVVNCIRSSLRKVDIIKVIDSDGAIQSSHTIGNATDEVKYCRAKNFNNRLMGIGLFMPAGNTTDFIRNIMFNSATTEQKNLYHANYNLDFGMSGAMDNACDALAFSSAVTGKMTVIKHFSISDASIEWAKEFSIPVGASVNTVSRSLIDGGYILGINTGLQSEIILLKTDSSGVLPGCAYQEIAITLSEFINTQNTISLNTAAYFNLSNTNASIAINNSSLTIQTDCNTINCPQLPPTDTCLSSYYKVYRSNSHSDAFGSHVLLKNDNQFLTTYRYDRIYSNQVQGSAGIKLFDEAGNFIKGAKVFLDSISASPHCIKADDSHVLLIFDKVINGKYCYNFTLIDDSLRIVRSKTLRTYSGTNFPGNLQGVSDIERDTDGNYYMVWGSMGFFENPKIMLLKIDSLFNPVWFKAYEVVTGSIMSTTPYLAVTNSSVIVVSEGTFLSVSLRFNKNTGDLLNTYSFQNRTDGVLIKRMLEFSNDRLLLATNNQQSVFTVGILDTTGKPLKLRYINSSSSLRASTVKSGMLYGLYTYFRGNSLKEVFLKLDSNLNRVFIKENDLPNNGFNGSLCVNNGNYIYTAGNFGYGGISTPYYDPRLRKLDPDGNLGTCNSIDTINTFTDITLNIGNPAYINVPVGNFSPIDSLIVTFSPDYFGQQVSQILCSSSPNCSSIHINGQSQICASALDYNYQLVRNPGCALPAIWSYDTSFITILNSTDSSIRVKFRKNGTTYIKASLNTGCRIISDSIKVDIAFSTLYLYLGSDRNLCPGDTVILNSGGGFSSYQWQDGSSDSSFLATSPGLYYVQVTDNCNRIQNDSINILPSIIPALNIGQQVTICKGDTATIVADNGFTTYSWQPNSLSGNTGPHVFSYIVNGNDQLITLTATTSDGCKAYDTLLIKSKYARPVFLGNDTSFCESDSLRINAGPGYLHYLWSTGSTSDNIVVYNSNDYAITVTDTNSCKAYDTIHVFPPHLLPKPDLGNNFDLCSGQSKILDPGNFYSYLWQNNSSNRTFIATRAGTYWVKVTDTNLCSNTDSVTLQNIFPLPSDFLISTDSICQFDHITISAMKSYLSYLWSNGSTQQSINISSPGIYMLQVTDSNNCSGSDSISIIQKECMHGVFIPSAFTPNKDPINSIFRALVYGNVIAFRFEIYNRFGQLVFSTSDPSKGWDGNFKGIPQPTSTFVWKCYYHLEGGNATTKMGTVVLLR